MAFGLAGSRACLQRIAAATETLEAFDALWTEKLEAVRPRWEALTRRAADVRLGAIVNGETLGWLTDNSKLGIPLLALLAEAGFQVTVLLVKDAALDTAVATASLSQSLPPGHTLNVIQVDGHASVQEAMAASGLQALYSDYAMDWRLSSLGMGQFSLRHFEPGLLGALRTVENLLTVCTLPFYRRYSAHLARLPGRWND